MCGMYGHGNFFDDTKKEMENKSTDPSLDRQNLIKSFCIYTLILNNEKIILPEQVYIYINKYTC